MHIPTPAQLYIWDDRFLWASATFKGAMTRRYATNVIAAIAPGTPFRLQSPGRPPQSCGLAVCAAGARRSVDATDVPFLSLNLDPGTADARRLERLVAQRPVRPLDRRLLRTSDAALRRLLEGRLDGAQARALGDRIVRALAGRGPAAGPLDARVHEIAGFLRQALPADVHVEDLARRVGLSPPRLMHLFTEQVGLSMSRFLLWQKMRRAVSQVNAGRSLTDIAHDCGFADSSHLTRTFQAFYAVKPSVLLDSSYVQVRVF